MVKFYNQYDKAFYACSTNVQLFWLQVDVTQPGEAVPNCSQGKIKLTPPAYSHTTVLLVSSLTTYSWLIVAGMNSW